MLVRINNVLTKADLAHITELIAQASWNPGKDSAGSNARAQKSNLEMDQQSSAWKTINETVVGKLYTHSEFQSKVLPSKVSAAYVSRCQTGMAFGQHIDDPIMGAANARYRSDIAVTVFLSEPETYAGGELTIHSPFGPVAVKLAAGSAIAYPASFLHEVTEVTDGERLVCVLWAQSHVRDTEQRQILSDLDDVRKAMAQATPGSQVGAKTDQIYANLLRRWSDV